MRLFAYLCKHRALPSAHLAEGTSDMVKNALVNALLGKADDAPRFGEITPQMEAYAAIGEGISTWAAMESLLVLLAAGLLKIETVQAGTIFYNILNFHSWLTILSELFESSTEEEARAVAAQWHELTPTLTTLNSIRVRLAHQVLNERDLTVIPVALNPTKKAKAEKAKRISKKEIVKFRTDIHEMNKKLIALTLVLWKHHKLQEK